MGNFTSKISKDSPIKDNISITPYKNIDPKESILPVSKITSKVAEREVSKPK